MPVHHVISLQFYKLYTGIRIFRKLTIFQIFASSIVRIIREQLHCTTTLHVVSVATAIQLSETSTHSPGVQKISRGELLTDHDYGQARGTPF